MTENLKKNHSNAPVRGKTFRIQVEERGSFYIDLTSYFFDAYLVLLDADGSVLAEDDDGLVATHARVAHEFEVGSSYKVEACALQGETGPFEILLRTGKPKELSAVERGTFAIADAQEAIQRVEAFRGPDHLDLADSLNALGELLWGQGSHAEAQSFLERSLRIREKGLGPDHPEVATSLNNLSSVLQAQALFVEARSLLERALRIYEESLGPDHPDVANSLSYLAHVLNAQGRISEAVQLLERSLEITEKSFGPDHPNVARGLNGMAHLLLVQGLFSEARPLLQRSLEITEKFFGPDHLYVGIVTNNLARVFNAEGHYAEARLLFERSLGIREKWLGPDHPKVATGLNNLANLLQLQGHFTEARRLLERSLGIREKSLGPDHPDVATSLNNLANLNSAQGLLSEARPRYERSLAIREKFLGPDHPDVATVLNNLAILLQKQGLHAEARPLFERSLAIRDKSLGPEHPDTAITMKNLAGLLLALGLYDEAKLFYERSMVILEKSFGPDHRRVASALNGWAALLHTQGHYAEARPFFERALGIYEESLGPSHPLAASLVNNMGGLLESQGLYAEARHLYERSLDIWEKSLGPDHPDVARALNNLTCLLRAQGLYSEARPLCERSLGIWEKSLGPDHPDVATSLSNLASLLHFQGLYAEAIPLFERSLRIYEESLGSDHPDVANVLHSLAFLFQTRGFYDEARPLFERALGIYERSLGSDHPHVALALNNLAFLEADVGESARAFELSSRALRSLGSHFKFTLSSQTESERLRFAALMRKSLEIYLSVARELTGAEWRDEVISLVLSWKGNVARSLFDGGDARASSPEERAIVEQLRSVQKRLSNALYLREVADRKAHGQLLESLRKRRGELELALVRSRGEGEEKGEKERERRWKSEEGALAISSVLPKGSLAVSFLVHRVRIPAEWKNEELVRTGGWEASRVSAFVVGPEASESCWVDLGEATVLEKATKTFLDELVKKRGIVRSPENGEVQSTTPAGDRLRKLLWDPLRQAIGGAELVILSPDSFLGTLPFETLQEQDGSFLVEHRSFVYMQDLMSLVEKKPRGMKSSPRLLAAGAIDYRRRGKLRDDIEDVELIASLETRGGLPKERWPRLSMTGQEADAITGFFEEMTEDQGDYTLLVGKDATEEIVKTEMERNTFIHLATHGYFQPDSLPAAWRNAQRQVEEDQDRLMLEETERVITGLMPGLLSGLVLAGANAAPEEGRDNGLLTAEEVTHLALSDCDLVVLSACETGLGRPEGGEGMIGLRRSFRMAGARTVISSLWQVRDDSTQELMVAFYENLWLKENGEA